MLLFLPPCLFLLLIGVENSSQDCTNEPVVLSQDFDKFFIYSNTSGNTFKTSCLYTFSVPMYFAPTIYLIDMKLSENSQVIVKQFSTFGGAKTYRYGKEQQGTDTFWRISPTNFTVEFDLSDRTPDDTFSVMVQVTDNTPKTDDSKFSVPSYSSFLLDGSSLPGKSKSVQRQTDPLANPEDKYSMRVVVYNEGTVTYEVMSVVYIYDGIDFKGTLLDVLHAENASQLCLGSQFNIVNTNSNPIGVFTILISGKTEWPGQIFALPSSIGNSTMKISATNGLTVFYEVNNPYSGFATPTLLQNFQFRGDGILELYAGCVNSRQENRRIATIAPSESSNYDYLQVFGRCRTYVLSQGVVGWDKVSGYQSNYKHAIGRKGVIMSDNFPTINNSTEYSRNYLIQPPDENTKIAVNYEIAHISAKTTLQIRQDIKAGSSNTQLYTQSDNGSNITIGQSYQQYISYNIPNESDGILIRYTVLKSAGTLNVMTISYFVCFAMYFM